MPLHVQLIQDALNILNLDTWDALQIHAAETFRAMHHPPLNPDVAALIVDGPALDLTSIQKILLNQYPPDHEIRVVSNGRYEQLALSELDHLDSQPVALFIPPLPAKSSFEYFQEIIAHLRAPEGCPWDRKQTHASLRPYLLEETYEVLDALDSGNYQALREEMGDLLLQIVLHSQIAVEANEFSMADVIAAVNAKIIHRHPHVWGSGEVNGAEDVKTNWDKIKQVEKQKERKSRLDGVPKSLPALSQAFSYQDRAARVKFDWETIEPVIAKVHEELAELMEASDDESRAKEAGDLLFAVVNLARWMDIEPESALRGTNSRFYRRFAYIEQRTTEQGRTLEEMTLADMDALWDEAKAQGL